MVRSIYARVHIIVMTVHNIKRESNLKLMKKKFITYSIHTKRINQISHS